MQACLTIFHLLIQVLHGMNRGKNYWYMEQCISLMAKRRHKILFFIIIIPIITGITHPYPARMQDQKGMDIFVGGSKLIVKVIMLFIRSDQHLIPTEVFLRISI